MNDTIYLVFSKEGVSALRKTIPQLKAGEYATRIDIHVDDKYFKRIIPIAKMELDDKFLIEPKIELEPVEEVTENLDEQREVHDLNTNGQIVREEINA